MSEPQTLTPRDSRSILDMNGCRMSMFALDEAIKILNERGSVVIRGVPLAPERTFRDVHDLEILKANADLFY